MYKKQDIIFLQQSIHLARSSMESNIGGPFGAVIIKDGVMIGKGSNKVTTSNDPTAHAEIVAIRNACKTINDFCLQGCSIYTSCEPCPMCLAAIYWARMEKIFFANNRKEAEKIGFDDSFLYEEIPLELEKRKLPIIKIDLPEAIQLFEDWKNKTDKVSY